MGNDAVFWSDLFLTPFLTGLGLALTLPVLGCFLRLRDEWLAALAYAQVAAAGALLALVLGGMPALGGMAAAGLAGLGKPLFSRRLAGGASFALLLLAGWAIAVLLAANQPLAERLGHALFDGQLYFADARQLWLTAPWSVFACASLFVMSRHLLLARVYPDYFRARHLRSWPVVIGFDLIAALTLALATMTMGVMGGFALVFVPAWIVFRRARSWRRSIVAAGLIGVVAYILAFQLALWLDQPFGPILALFLILLGMVIA